MIQRRAPIHRNVVPINRRPKKRKHGGNPEFLAWLREWPCWVCFERHCRKYNFNPVEFRAHIEARQYFYEQRSRWDCGVTEAAHVGVRGLGQKCPDKEAMPLGTRHHEHATAGGGPGSHHTLGKGFWQFHGIDRAEVLAELHRLYVAETGRTV